MKKYKFNELSDEEKRAIYDYCKVEDLIGQELVILNSYKLKELKENE